MFPKNGGDAESGVYLDILPNGSYTIAYFGGIDVGTWAINVQTKNLEMQPFNNLHESFYVYGRKNTSLAKDMIRLEFNVGDNFYMKPEPIVSFDNQEGIATQMQPIINQESNCWKYPESYTALVMSKNASKVHVAIPVGEHKNESLEDRVQPIDVLDYSFDTAGQYNDYIINYNKRIEKSTAKIIGLFKDKMLYLDENPVSEKSETSPNNLKELAEFAAEVFKPIAKTQEISLAYKVHNTYYLLEKTTKESKKTDLNLKKPLLNSTCGPIDEAK